MGSRGLVLGPSAMCPGPLGASGLEAAPQCSWSGWVGLRWHSPPVGPLDSCPVTVLTRPWE